VNTFVKIIRLEEFSFNKVKYYSIQYKDNDINEFYDFLNRMEDFSDVEDDLSNLVEWIEQIGEEHGAKKDFFRNEQLNSEAKALPPPYRKMKAYDIIINDLRLYCMVANEHVVFLFNGGIKTTVYDARDCPNVGPYFKQANKIVKKLDELFRDRSITWNSDQTDIDFDPELEIEI
jgi:hypothetical protein